jgi:hypothetical protein
MNAMKQLILVIAIFSFAAFDRARAQQIQVSFPAKAFDDFGAEVLRQFRKPFEENLAKEGGKQDFGDFSFLNWIGIEGTRKPSGKAAYFGTASYDGGIGVFFAVIRQVNALMGLDSHIVFPD